MGGAVSVITAGTTLTSAFTVTGDTNGNLVFKTGAGATTALTLGSNQSATFAGTVSINGQAYTWPASYGVNGQFLQTNGAGTLTWATVSVPQGIPTLAVVTATTQAASASYHYVLTNVAATTVTLPASPVAGDLIYVTVGNNLKTNVVARNGSNIMGLAQDLTLDANYAAVQLRYINSTLGWVMI